MCTDTAAIRVPSLPQALAKREPRDEPTLNSLDARIGGYVHPTAWPAGPYRRVLTGDPLTRRWVSPEGALRFESACDHGDHG